MTYQSHNLNCLDPFYGLLNVSSTTKLEGYILVFAVYKQGFTLGVFVGLFFAVIIGRSPWHTRAMYSVDDHVYVSSSLLVGCCTVCS